MVRVLAGRLRKGAFPGKRLHTPPLYFTFLGHELLRELKAREFTFLTKPLLHLEVASLIKRQNHTGSYRTEH